MSSCVDLTRFQLQHDVALNCVLWTDPSKVLVLPGDEEPQLLLKLCLKVKRQEETLASDKTPGVVSDGCSGDFYPLCVYTTHARSFNKLSANMMSLQLRPRLRNSGGAGTKRKREAVEADEQDEAGDE